MRLTESWVARRSIEITTRVSGDGIVPCDMHAYLRDAGGLHGILERADAAALGDEVDDVLSSTILRAQLVADISAYTSWVVSEAVGSWIGFRRGADRWAYRSWAMLAIIASECDSS